MTLYENGSYCIYLRKSRADREAEQHGEGETLTRHEHILLELAKRLHITINTIYREVVSGENISARPVMQQLLSEVEQELWDGVLVVEVERLARGDTIDQGTVSRSFRFSNTKIITPTKIYDPNNEFDEEYFEFGLFMSRREYQTIKRRLNAGRISSVNEGKYVGNIPPYGYERIKLTHEKGFTLSPVPEQAAVVQLIYQLYVNGLDGEPMGISKIANYLNALEIPSAKNQSWSDASVKEILSNPVYIGMVRWNSRKTVKKIIDGQIVKQRPRSSEVILRKGLHPPVISQELFDSAQLIRSRHPSRPVNSLHVIRNPLAGLVYCSQCGRSMIRKSCGKNDCADSLICPCASCKTVSSRLCLVEQAVIDVLWKLLENYRLNTSLPEQTNNDITLSRKQLLSLQLAKYQKLSAQKQRLCDFLEQGIYSSEIFLERYEIVRKKLANCSDSIRQLESELKHERNLLTENDRFISPNEHILEHYRECDALTRNKVLKELIEKIIYTKDVKNTYGHADEINFSLEIYPKIL